MKTAAVVVRGARDNHQHTLNGAFAEGLRRHGWRVDVSSNPKPADMLVIWGVHNTRLIEAQKARGGDVCVLERGYVGDRFNWTSVSFGGELNGRAEFRGISSNGARFDEHHRHLMQGWSHRDGYALLIGQVPGDASLRSLGGRLDSWLTNAVQALAGQGWRVVYRPHPEAVRKGLREPRLDCEINRGPLADALAGAGVVVTWNSNTGVDAVLAGVPTIAMDEGAMAGPVASHALNDPIVRPMRDRWAAELAWKQWLPDEMRSGGCWEVVKG